jgi:transcriptional regulator with XRE-family HTH domain
MAPRGSNHTPMGKKINALAANQAELSKILDLTQQSISGKLNGKIAVTLKDLELLATAYDVPQIYFVSDPEVTPDMARSWEQVLNGHAETRQAIELLATLPQPFAHMLLQMIKSIKLTAAHYSQPQIETVDSTAPSQEGPPH